MEAVDLLDLNREILRCAVLDDAGRIVRYVESDRRKLASFLANFSVTIKAIAIQSLSQSLPRDLGEVKFTEIASDRFRLVPIPLGAQTVMFALPIHSNPDPIYEAAIKKFGARS